MSHAPVRGHDAIAGRFRSALARGRLASTFLFVGPAGIGKRKFAQWLAQGMLCERAEEAKLTPCGECPSCRQVTAGTHPDVDFVARPADKAFIPVELLIGDKEHRMREGLCYNISLKPFSGRRKVAIIDDADYLHKEGANCLLKTLEEPPLKSVLILIGTSEQRQLPTIRSRCQTVRFSPLSNDDVADILLAEGLAADAAAAQQAAAKGNGSVSQAARWTDERLVEFRAALFDALSQSEPSQLETAKMIGQFVEEAGKESAAKRDRLRLVVSLAGEFYRQALIATTRGTRSGDRTLDEAIARAFRWMPGNEAPAGCLELCLDAYASIDANANQATLIDWWLDELTACARSGRVLAP
jgi:DNA polymerase-3 subunit delta'